MADDDDEKSATVMAIDKILAGYYEYRDNTEYYDSEDGEKVGKFYVWATENGYDTNVIEQELFDDDADYTTTELITFDDDFPTDLKDDYKKLFIFELLKSYKGKNQLIQKDSKWDRIVGAYHVWKYEAKLVYLNTNEFAVVCPEDVIDDKYHSKESRHYKKTMWIYNCIDKKWRFEFKYDSWTFRHGCIAYSQRDHLYFECCDDHIQTLDPKVPGKYENVKCHNNASKFITHVKPIEDEIEMRRNNKFRFWGSNAWYEHQRDKVHIMGGRRHACHTKFQPKSNALKWDVTYPNLGWERGNTDAGCVYLKTQHKVMAFGGNKCPLPDYPDEHHDDVWVHAMKGREWLKFTALPQRMTKMGYTIDKNERYLIISEGTSGIYRLCLNDWKWQQAKFDSPTIQYHGIHLCSEQKDEGYRKMDNRTNDMHLVWGYVRYIYKYGGFKIKIPEGRILNVVVDFLVEREWLHIVDCLNGAHWRMLMKDLFEDFAPYMGVKYVYENSTTRRHGR